MLLARAVASGDSGHDGYRHGSSGHNLLRNRTCCDVLEPVATSMSHDDVVCVKLLGMSEDLLPREADGSDTRQRAPRSFGPYLQPGKSRSECCLGSLAQYIRPHAGGVLRRLQNRQHMEFTSKVPSELQRELECSVCRGGVVVCTQNPVRHATRSFQVVSPLRASGATVRRKLMYRK